MLSYVGKWKIMHIGYNNRRLNMKYGRLEEAAVEQDLGVMILNDLECSTECAKQLKWKTKHWVG